MSTSDEPITFAYWVPNVSGGLVTSDIEQRTDWGYDYNRELAVLAENNGFEYALSQVRYIASYGAAYQHESTSFSLALLLATERLKVIAAVHPGLWQPGVLAKFIATADHLSGGRAAVNVVSGWFKDEFTKLGEPWLEHDERYHRSEAAANGRRVRSGLNGFMIARDTEKEAQETLREIVAKANVEAVHGFRDAVTQAGSSTSDNKGMWADSSFEDLVQYNDGFRTRLIGTPEQIAQRIVEYKKRGVNLLLLGFLHYHEEVEYFGKNVLPIVRQLEADLVPAGV
jgi:dimethylsulfone monooxygenase